MKLPSLGLAIGALAGGGLVLASALWPGGSPIPTGSDTAALVNGQAIPVEDIGIALEAMARDSRNPLADTATEQALNRLIDEELLFQRAIELDIPRTASTVRRTIVMTMIDLAQSQAITEPDDSELRRFFNANIDFFRGEDRYRITWESSATVDGTRSRPPAHPPARLITLSDMRRYLGEDLTQAVRSIAVGETSGPIPNGDRYHWLTVSEIVPATTPRFADHREQVESLWRDRAAEAALEAYIAELRAMADIRLQATSAE